MKRFLLWSFERGSIQYDAICIVILAFIFLTPRTLFKDGPRVPSDQSIRQTITDDAGHAGFTVSVTTEQAAIDHLRASLGYRVNVVRTEPVYDAKGALVAFSVWIER